MIGLVVWLLEIWLIDAKPAPDSLILACFKLNKDPENSIYIGDDRRDIIAGQRAKMKTAIADFGFINL